MEIKTPAGMLAKYIKDTLPQLVTKEIEVVESNIRVPLDGEKGADGVGIVSIELENNYIVIILSNNKKYKLQLPFKEIDKRITKDVTAIKSELITWSKDNLTGKDGVNGRNGMDGTDGIGIKDIRINARGDFIVETDTKEYNLGNLKKILRRGGSGGGITTGSDFTYTNSMPMPSDVGGFSAGTTFDRVPLLEMFNGLLYAYSKPSFTSFIIHGSALIYEVGDGISEGEAQTDFVIANPELLEANSIKIVHVNNGDIIAEHLPNISPVNLYYPSVTYDVPTDCIFRISALDTNGDSFQRDFVIKFLSRIFVGESDLEELTESDVESLRISQLKTDINGQYSMLAGGYKWFCYPQVMGTRLNFFDIGTGFEIAMDDDPLTLVLTNEFGVEASYYCYRSINILHGALNIEVRP